MGGLKKLMLLVVTAGVFSISSYHLVWSPDWQIQRWPETRARKVLIEAYAQLLIQPKEERALAVVDAVQKFDPELEAKIFNRLLLCLGLTLLSTVLTNLLPMLVGLKKDDARLRGAELVSTQKLKQIVLLRQWRKTLFLPGLYALLVSALGFVALTGYVSSLVIVAIGCPVGIALFLISEIAIYGKVQRQQPIRIGGIPVPAEVEARHFLIQGTTGAGKSQVIYSMVKDARKRGDRGLVMDIGGAYLKRFRRPGDLVLSADEQSSTRWNPFAEIRHRRDFATLAAAAIPDGKGESAGWNDKARVMLSAVMQGLHDRGEHSISRLVYLCCTAEKKELAPLLAGTSAAVLVQDGNDTMMQNVRGIITTYIQPWTYLPDGGEFSIKHWIERRQPGQWLFITYDDGQLKAIRQLLATWLDLAIAETLCLDPETAQPTWFVADEFDSLGQVSSARDALTKMRKYAGRCIFGMQTVAQFWSTYGRDGAQVLLSCLSNKLILRAGDPDTAEYCSKSLGDEELLRSEQSKSRRGLFGLGGDPSKTNAERHVTQRVVMASEIENAPDLTGWLNLAGDLPVAKVKILIVKM
ncbi:MAG: type IV secretion system DNA-binding domain-containing protein [Dechloromonas sp.]|nr:type IV secretion system DNA-binding domain-containing protein [Dechloromonas sp.]